MSRSNKPVRVRLSHFPHDTTFLHTAVAAADLTCDIGKEKITSGETYYYIDTNGRMTVTNICAAHKYMFTATGHQKPYWTHMPTQGATQDIRTTDDAGWREYIDGIYDEWQEIWDSDLLPEE